MIHWGNTGTDGPGWARVWLYGETGSGKTTAAAYGWPKPYFVLVYNENSQTTLRGLARMLGTDFGYVILGIPEQARADARPAVRADFEQVCNAFLQAAANNQLAEQFGQTIVCDNMTHYNDLAIADILAERKKSKMENQEWGILRSHYLHARDVLWRLPAHVILTSLRYAKMDREQTVIAAGPAIQGSGGDLLPSSCDAIGYCETQHNGERVTHFRQFGKFPARHRYPGMPEGPMPNHQVWAAMSPFLRQG